MGFDVKDIDAIRKLSGRLAQIASLPVHDEKRELWRKLNRLESIRPMVWINEIPWWEFEEDEEELKCICEDEFARNLERELRRAIYTWAHLRTDMIVDPVLYSNYVHEDTGFGLEVQTVGGCFVEGFGAQEYVPVIRTEADIEKIKTPRITPDWEGTERNYQMMCELVDGSMPVEKRGVTWLWTAPWDMLIQWFGVTEFFMDMVDRPEFVHRAISHLMDAYIARLDQLEELGLLSVSNGNHRVGSNGLGISDELPQADYDGKHARPIDQWGMSTGQIFSEVSPEMHDEFCVQYEMKWIERFGLVAYGCCEPLHNKIGMLRKIKRLRKISMSPWVDVEKGAADIGEDYVFAYKPNPSVLAWDEWNLEAARKELRDVLEKTKGCHVEIIMKDISTIRHDPKRLWEWCELAVETAGEFAR